MTTINKTQAVIFPFADKAIDRQVSPAVLRKLVLRAQKHEPLAQNLLCRLYVPMVKSIYSNNAVRFLLGEDAVSIVWELFLEFIQSYKGSDFVNLPGLIRKHLQDRTKNSLRKPGNYLLRMDPNSEALATIPQEDTALEDYQNLDSFYSLLKGCTPREQLVAKYLYVDALDKSLIAKTLGCSRRTIFRIEQAILKKAKANI